MIGKVNPDNASTMSHCDNLLQRINSELPEEWEAKLVAEQGRIYYLNHKDKASSWVPPTESWDPGSLSLPHGWECAVDKNNKPYFINHLDKYTTRDDPRDDPDYVEPPKPREVELLRDPLKGFGFVAGSEKPVVVRFVTDGGPSIDKLLPGDQIIRINGEDVKKSPREYVIDCVRSCKDKITLTVCQPYTDNSTKKSSLLTAAKKAKLKNNPSRVRFAECVTVNMVNGGSPPQNPSHLESYVPFMPNVLKVFLENGQTKSFKYDNKTTVKDVVHSLQEKLSIKKIQHFNLVLLNTKSHMPNRVTLLQEHETLAEIASKPGARHFRCLFRVMFVPRDPYDLLKEDPVAFEYFYLQCCNDVVNERFPDLKGDTVLKLAALQIQQHAMSNNVSGKINLKAIEKECGLEKFVPVYERSTMRGKDLRKLLTQQMKVNQNLTAPGQKHLTALQAKLHYMKIVSEQKTFGARVFMVTLLDKKTEAMILVGPKAGISLITNIKTYNLSLLADFDKIKRMKVAKERENMQKVEISLNGEDQQSLNIGLLKQDTQNFVTMVEGYYKIFVDAQKSLSEKPASKQTADPLVPVYTSKHRVIAAPWSYPEDIVSQVIGLEDTEILENQRVVDCRRGPPNYEESHEYIKQIKEDLGIEGEQPLKTESESSGVISLAGDDKENNNVVKDQPKNKSVIVISKEPETVIQYSNGGTKISPVKLTKEPPVVLHSKEDSEDQGYQNGSVLETSDTKPSSGDDLSDTDSGVESEKKATIGDLTPPDTQPCDGESVDSDSDSWGAPSNSPEKGRHVEPATNRGVWWFDGLSFGVHNPVELPRSETDFQVIASSFGLLSPDKIPPGIEEGILDPRMFSERKLFIDPDIIDLTLLPPPSSHDQDAAMTTWKPSLTSSLPIGYDVRKAINKQPTQHHPPPIERSASMGDNPDFLDEDIDAFIASMMIPPPPESCMTSSVSDDPVESLQFPMEEEEFHMYNGADSLISSDEVLSSLVIPPPPGDASESIEEIHIVPPVNSESLESKKRYKHRRSSSLDISSLRRFNDTLDSSEPTQENSSKSCDSNIQPPNSLKTSSNPSKDFESPATVSEKLTILLQSMPNFGSAQEADMKFRRTSSLRLEKSASFEVLSSPPNEIDTTSSNVNKKVGRSNSFQVHLHGKPSVIVDITSQEQETLKKSGQSYTSPKKNRAADPPKKEESKSSPKSNYSRHLRRTHSFDIIPKKGDEKESGEKTSGDNFASLKAKLKSYRDYLLSKSDSSKHRKSPVTHSENSDDSKTSCENAESPLKRSNSFTFNWLKRRSNSLDSIIAKPSSDSESTQESSQVDDTVKRVPQVLSTLNIPRSTFKPHSNLSVQGTSVTSSDHLEERMAQKKSGPMKALSSVILSADKKHSKDHASTKGSRPMMVANGNVKHDSKEEIEDKSEEPVRPRRNSQRRGSKDNISGTYTPKSSSKELSPFDTFGSSSSIWRPMSMRGKSTIKDDSEESRTYTNFDALRDITAGRSPQGTDSKVTKKPPPRPAAPPDLQKLNVSLPNGDLRQRKGSFSEESFAIVSDKISVSHSDSVKLILDKTYSAMQFDEATKDADRLLSELKQTLETLKDTRIDRRPKQFGMCKEELNNRVKQFVYDAKFLVSNATQTEDKLAENLNTCMHTLAKVFLHTQATMIMMVAVHQAQQLGFEVIKVTNSFKSTLNAAKAACGKPLSDPHMRYLMRQATSLATLLSSLLKNLKVLEQK